MNKEDLREEWLSENPPKYGHVHSSWEQPIYTESKCYGHGNHGEESVANIDYVYWLEQRVLFIDNMVEQGLYQPYKEVCPVCKGISHQKKKTNLYSIDELLSHICKFNNSSKFRVAIVKDQDGKLIEE